MINEVLGVKYASFSCWDRGTVDTGLTVETSAYILLFRCQYGSTAAEDSLSSFIIPIAIGNNRINIWRGSSIDIKEESGHPTSDIQFSISQNKTLLVTGTYGAIIMTAISIKSL